VAGRGQCGVKRSWGPAAWPAPTCCAVLCCAVLCRAVPCRAVPCRAPQVIYVEAISNPLMQVPDLPGVAAFGRTHGLVSVIDATFATPVLLRPAALGFDIVLHSATKYLNGHSDLIAGVQTWNTSLRGAAVVCACTTRCGGGGGGGGGSRGGGQGRQGA
jgi:hypothetical protein